MTSQIARSSPHAQYTLRVRDDCIIDAWITTHDSDGHTIYCTPRWWQAWIGTKWIDYAASRNLLSHSTKGAI